MRRILMCLAVLLCGLAMMGLAGCPGTERTSPDGLPFPTPEPTQTPGG